MCKKNYPTWVRFAPEIFQEALDILYPGMVYCFQGEDDKNETVNYT